MIFLYISNLLIPLIILIGGLFMKYKTPKKINGWVGYRTTMSMKNEETWQFAHNYCGGLWIKIGLILTLIAIAGCMISAFSGYVVASIISVILMVIQVATLLLSIAPTERELKKHFDENGNKIQ